MMEEDPPMDDDPATRSDDDSDPAAGDRDDPAANPAAEPMTGGDGGGDAEVGARICRYCLMGDEDVEDGDEDADELVSPCACRGDQRWVHLDCLRRWQRSVLVTQPTHPAFYESDERQSVCGVCRTTFSAAYAPPERSELMRSFTGPELAALLDIGCLIVCERRTARRMDAVLQLTGMPSLRHWARGVYLIVGVEVCADRAFFFPRHAVLQPSTFH